MLLLVRSRLTKAAEALLGSDLPGAEVLLLWACGSLSD